MKAIKLLHKKLSAACPDMHDIKRMDRLIGNAYLHAERKAIYQYLSKQLIG